MVTFLAFGNSHLYLGRHKLQACQCADSAGRYSLASYSVHCSADSARRYSLASYSNLQCNCTITQIQCRQCRKILIGLIFKPVRIKPPMQLHCNTNANTLQIQIQTHIKYKHITNTNTNKNINTDSSLHWHCVRRIPWCQILTVNVRF